MDIVGNLKPPLPIFTDSNGALNNILAAGYGKSRNKHINVKLHLCRNLHASGNLELSHVSTDNNLADIMTKVLRPGKHGFFTQGIGLQR